MKLAGVAAAAAVLVFGASAPAAATAGENAQYRLILTAGLGAYPRSEPVFDARTGIARPEGSMITASCWLYGQEVTNPYDYSSSVWVQDVTGVYWPEIWLDTGSEGVPVGLRQCGETEASDASTPNSFYNRADSVRWAREHAPHDPHGGFLGTPACTWFVSNALWHGGFPQDDTWTSSGDNGRLRKVQGSVTAWSVVDFYAYITSHFDVETVELTTSRFHSNAVPEARMGDLMVYDWEGDGVWDHFAIITGMAAGDYPEVSEWGVSNTYVKRGWTYSINSNGWLQQGHPNVRAQLIRIAGGHWTETVGF